jgi:hypothetical protein
MLSLSIRALGIRPVLFSKPAVLQTASYAITRGSRDVATSHESTPDDTDTVEAANNGMDQITNILDNVPQSNNFRSELLLVSTPPLIFLRFHSWCKI